MVTILAQLPAILIAISIHEFGHALVAYWLGDNTAKNEGRLSVDPLKHIDIAGFILLLIAGFGWARPVPVNFSNFKNTRLAMCLVSIAGPIFNIITSIIVIYILKAEVKYLNIYAVNMILVYIFKINIMFAVFNLLPIPPLDGSKVVLSFLPLKAHYFYYKYEAMGSFLLMFLIITNTTHFLMGPLYKIINNIMAFFI